MNEPVEYFINFDISEVDEIGKIVIDKGWLLPIKNKLTAICMISNKHGFNYKIDGNKLSISIKAPEKDIDKLAKMIAKDGTEIIKEMIRCKKSRKDLAYERKTRSDTSLLDS